MSDRTGIEWTDATWNPTTGCTEVGTPGCDNCYARTLADRFWGGQYEPNEDGTPRTFHDVRLHPDRLDQPLRWTKPRLVFVNSVSDLFHADVPREFISQVFAVMALTPQHTYQILTKRPGRMRSSLDRSFWRAVERVVRTKGGEVPDYYMTEAHLPNVWLGVSVEDQKRADKRIPVLLDTPGAVRFISAEPLLGPVDLGYREPCDHPRHPCLDIGCWRALDWVIVGGESGPGARPMHPDWARSLRDQCADAGVRFFFKQWGAWRESEGAEERENHYLGAGWPPMVRVGKKAAGRELDGRTWDEMPAIRTDQGVLG